jgi:hypothetical protein
MLTFLLDMNGVIVTNFLKKGSIINSEIYCLQVTEWELSKNDMGWCWRASVVSMTMHIFILWRRYCKRTKNSLPRLVSFTKSNTQQEALNEEVQHVVWPHSDVMTLDHMHWDRRWQCWKVIWVTCTVKQCKHFIANHVFSFELPWLHTEMCKDLF